MRRDNRAIVLGIIVLVSFCATANARPEPLRIVALGASNTSGTGVGTGKAYPAQLEKLLQAKKIDARVVNAGRAFDTTAGMLRRLDRDVVAGTDIVILQPGGNDLRFFGSRKTRAANVEEIQARLRKRGIKVIVYDERLSRRYYGFDRIHLTRAGHAFVAAQLLPRVLKTMNESKRERTR